MADSAVSDDHANFENGEREDQDEHVCAHSHDHHGEEDAQDEDEAEPAFMLRVTLHNKPIDMPIYSDSATVQDLSDMIADDLHIPASHQKFIISPKVGLLRPPFADPQLPLQGMRDKKIVLLGATRAEVATLEEDIAALKTRQSRRRAALSAGRKVHANAYRDQKKAQDEATYCFHTIKPLPYLPHPEKSQRYLERLAADPGIKASMRKHGFSVGLLTEMNPAEHTTHESRTLGLNRNRGEVIELRLRTDAYDGYRDYKVIRKTLCHELTHNVFGPHDSKFWNLCRQIEAEVERNDHSRGGHSVGGEEFFVSESANMDDEEADHGGWEGGEYVLGAGGAATSSSVGTEPLSRREVIARAAEERMRKQREAKTSRPSPKDGAKQ